jgi:hypothetical protein
MARGQIWAWLGRGGDLNRRWLWVKTEKNHDEEKYMQHLLLIDIH